MTSHTWPARLPRWSSALAGLTELLWGANCPGCAAPGWALCPSCRDSLGVAPRMCAARPGCPAAWAVGPYAGVLRELVVIGKRAGERNVIDSVGSALGEVALLPLLPNRGAVMVVPVPARRASGGYRSADPVLHLAERAAARARAHGIPAEVASVLRFRRAPRDQVGLGAAERRANLRDTMTVSSAARRPGPLNRRLGSRRIVLVDDVITTGATLGEAARALRCAGLVPSCAAVVAERM